ncbi:MAG: RibD family protein [Caulobacterales bacterium]
MSRPHITLKLATSLDGRIATGAGESRWITGPEARAEVHRLRGEAGAVLIGSGTALTDDPELTVRVGPAPARQPLRIVLDSRLRLPVRSKLIATLDIAPLLVIGAMGADPAAKAALESAGAEVALASGAPGAVTLAGAMAVLERRSVARILVEGGGRLAASFVKDGLIDRLEWMRAPLILGAEGRPAIDSLALSRLSAAPAFRRLAVRELGADLWETYERA